MLAPKCATCPGPVIRPKGRRGPLPKRCDTCRSAKPVPKPRAAPAPPRVDAVSEALRVELAAMPERVQACTEAAAARALAVQVDQGLSMTAATRELTRVLALLRAMCPAERAPAPARTDGEVEVPRGVADLASRAAARRAQAAG